MPLSMVGAGGDSDIRGQWEQEVATGTSLRYYDKWTIYMYRGKGGGHQELVCCKRFLYMAGYLRPSATISRWTTFPTDCYNCAIQDGVQEGRHGFAFTLQKDSHNRFPTTCTQRTAMRALVTPTLATCYVLGVSGVGGWWGDATNQARWTRINLRRKPSRMSGCHGSTQGMTILGLDWNRLFLTYIGLESPMPPPVKKSS